VYLYLASSNSTCAVRSGVIGLATAVFPSKIKGNCLDSFARKHLWEVGLDYLHGTGHGVGAFLNVHEGPMGISWKVYPNDPGKHPPPRTHTLYQYGIYDYLYSLHLLLVYGRYGTKVWYGIVPVPVPL
jgi:Xaa-Pro aminopeptidase